ncbi:inositol polyphosphate multikinase-like protein [Dinothrombium tinctorium]|uniref:Kinase n=1 Tax=Dinothrombium tinctorium TaxID=1965070 RepID=A0A3S3PJ55_9ACAR|nr:inositol polyphosphate multikinase-like protein [Dinothrombium tinctorium]
MNGVTVAANSDASLEEGDTEHHLSPLPVGIEPLPNQVAGHFYTKSEKSHCKNYLLKENNTGYVLKAIGDKRGWRELHLYEDIWSPQCAQTHLLQLRSFVPVFRGLVELDDTKFLAMDDLCAGYQKPSVMDIKVGAITYDPEADKDKIEKEISKYPWAKTLGFRILGIRLYKKATDEYIVKDSYFGKTLTPETVTDGLLFYLNFDEKDCEQRSQLLKQLIARLHSIEEWFLRSNVGHLKFISSSLLFVYSLHDNHVKSDVKMIDFAHVFPNHCEPKSNTGDYLSQKSEASEAKAMDTNYLFGLQKIIEYLLKISEKAI